MKTVLFLLTIAFGCVFGDVAAQNRHREQPVPTFDTQSNHRNNYRNHHRPTYVVSNGKVFFNGHIVVGASAASFKTLSNGYAKDAWTVYYLGVKIDDAKSHSFIHSFRLRICKRCLERLLLRR